jgi:hypothetical protein
LENGRQIKADTIGNYIVITYPFSNCHPILLSALENQKGSSLHHAATCSNSRSGYYIISNLNADELIGFIVNECEKFIM